MSVLFGESLCGRPLLSPVRGDFSNVGSRLVWGSSIVRSFAEIIRHSPSSFGGLKLCEVARPNRIIMRISR